MSLSLSSQPGFTEVPDASFATGSAASDSAFKSLNDATKFAAVRNEQFRGYYRNGETVVLPVSPVDGYAYSRAECLYSWSWFFTGSAPGPCNGIEVPPLQGSTTGAGTVLQLNAYVDQSTGAVATTVGYWKTTQQNTTDGILCVVTHAQRQR